MQSLVRKLVIFTSISSICAAMDSRLMPSTSDGNTTPRARCQRTCATQPAPTSYTLPLRVELSWHKYLF